MKKALFPLLVFSFMFLSAQDRTKSASKTIKLDPEKNGFLGTVTIGYAFANCYGSTVMAYGYKDLNLTHIKHNGKKYTASQLGISSFNKYKTSFYKLNVSYYYGNSPIKKVTLTHLLDNYDIGCFGQTNTIAENNQKLKSNLGALGAVFSKAEYGYSIELGDLIRTYEKKRENLIKYNELVSEINRTTSIEKKLELTKEAKKYAENHQQLDDYIDKLENALAANDNKKQALANLPLKKPYEYTEQEWKSMSKSQQDKSLQYQLDEYKQQDVTLKQNQIDKEKQSEGYQKAAEGDYGTAIKTLSDSGDHSSALAVVGYAALEGVFKSNPEARRKRQQKREANRKAKQENIGDTPIYQKRKNILKMSLTSLAFGNYQFNYERVLNKTFSLGISYATIPNGDVPLKSLAEKYLDDPQLTNIIESASMSYTSFTPEIRIYVGKGYGKGFYLAPFYRGSEYNFRNVPFDYDADEGGTLTLNTNGTIKSNSFGLLLGTQFNLGNSIVLDWWIMGPHYGSSTGSFEGITPEPLSDNEQSSLAFELDDIDIPLIDIESQVSAQGAKISIDGPWAGIRAGFSLGFRF